MAAGAPPPGARQGRRAGWRARIVTIRPTDAWSRAERDAARAILLEKSPWPIDGGEAIGRDPRKIPVEEFAQAGLEGNPLLRVIRAKCLDCCGGQESEVRKCVAIACPNWPYRMGANPFRAAREITEEQREQLVARMARARAASASQDASPANLTPIFQGSKSDGSSAGAGGPQSLRITISARTTRPQREPRRPACPVVGRGRDPGPDRAISRGQPRRRHWAHSSGPQGRRCAVPAQIAEPGGAGEGASAQALRRNDR